MKTFGIGLLNGFSRPQGRWKVAGVAICLVMLLSTLLVATANAADVKLLIFNNSGQTQILDSQSVDNGRWIVVPEEGIVFPPTLFANNEVIKLEAGYTKNPVGHVTYRPYRANGPHFLIRFDGASRTVSCDNVNCVIRRGTNGPDSWDVYFQAPK